MRKDRSSAAANSTGEQASGEQAPTAQATSSRLSPTVMLLTVGGFLSFFVFGFVDNLKGPLLPQLLNSGDFSYGQGGAILLAGYVGFILATLGAGVLSDVVSNRGVLLLASICLAVGICGFGTSTNYPLLVAFMAVIGVGLGAIELAANGLMIEIHGEHRARYLNLLATCHGLGSLLVPLYAAWLLLNTQMHWQTIYATCCVLVVPLIVIFGPWFSRQTNADADRSLPGERAQHWNWKFVRRQAFTRQMWTYYTLIAAYVAAELGVGAWMVEFLQAEHAKSVAVSSYFLSSFFCLLMLGRFVGAFFVEQVGYSRAMTVALLGSALCLAGGIFGGERFLLLLPLSGLFMSIVFPTVAAAVSNLHQANVGTVLGILFAFAGLGGALGPWSIGVLSDIVGLQIGFGSSVVFALIALACTRCLRPG